MMPNQRLLMASPPAGIVKNGLVAWYDFVQNVDAQTLWNKVMIPKDVSNLITNGNFSQSTTGWDTYSGSSVLTASNNTLTVTGTGNNSYPIARYSNICSYVSGKKLYIKPKIKVTNSACSVLKIWVDSTSGMTTQEGILVTSPAVNTVYNKGALVTLTSGGTGSISMRILSVYADNSTANGKITEIQEVMAIDLTALFGAGNEPTAAQCDVLFAGWFDGTVSRELPLYNGTLGSTTGSDTNDPTWTSQGLSFGSDDYANSVAFPALGYNWTIMTAAKRATGITAEGDICSLTSGGASGVQFYQSNTNVVLKSGSASVTLAGIPPNETVNIFTGQSVKDALRVKVGNSDSRWTQASNADVSTLLNIGRIGAAGYFWNGDIYILLIYNRALSDYELKQNNLAIKKELAKRGVAVA